MAGVLERLKNALEAEDEATNAIVGGSPRETLSGSAGRALAAGKPWGKPAVTLIDALFGRGHCVRQATLEAARRGSDPQ